MASSDHNRESSSETINVYKECSRNHKRTCMEFLTTAERNSLEAVWCICGCHAKDHRVVELLPPPTTTSSSMVADASTVHPPLPPPPQLPPIDDNHHAEYNVGTMSSVVEVSEKIIRRGGEKKRRPRTMFTAYQKEKLREYAEKVGWTVQKKDKPDRIRFCEEIGITTRSCKNWITNNRKQHSNIEPSTKLCL